MSDTLATDQLEQLRELIARSEQWEKDQRVFIHNAKWALMVQSVAVQNHDTLRVTLRGSSGAEGAITVTVPQQSYGSYAVEPGAVWRLYPGDREQTHTEKLLAARKALLVAGGDYDKLTDEQRETIGDADRAF